LKNAVAYYSAGVVAVNLKIVWLALECNVCCVYIRKMMPPFLILIIMYLIIL
jgi:hypothetical protein